MITTYLSKYCHLKKKYCHINQRLVPDSVIKCLLKKSKREKREALRDTTLFLVTTSVRMTEVLHIHFLLHHDVISFELISLSLQLQWHFLLSHSWPTTVISPMQSLMDSACFSVRLCLPLWIQLTSVQLPGVLFLSPILLHSCLFLWT